jgi:ABC-type multidrug transport system ATPase subunit
MELVIDQVSKRFGATWALRDVSLRCAPGLIGLVGPNGAGKTTLMRLIATLAQPTSGTITWNGRDTQQHGGALREVLGYLPQSFGIYPEFSGRKFLLYLAELKGLPSALARERVDEVLETTNLTQVADQRLSTYSGGMKQRIGIAQALLNDPALLIVDEPTAGLDPEERVRFRTLLASLTPSRVVLLSTHIVGDVEAVASRLVLLRAGQIVADTTPQDLLSLAAGAVWEVTLNQAAALRVQAGHRVTTMITKPAGVYLRIISATRPHEAAALAEPNLEDAVLIANAPAAVPGA